MNRSQVDVTTLIGRSADEARQRAEQAGYAVRVITPETKAITADLRSNRINLRVEGDRVVRAWFG